MSVDKVIQTTERNKDGETLTLIRTLDSQEIAKGYYKTSACYLIKSLDEPVGKIDVSVNNVNGGNEVEVEYFSDPLYRGRGNISVALPEVLNDIFVNNAFDGFMIKPGVISSIDTVILAINENNLASRKVAMNCGFKESATESFELTKEEFLKENEKIK